MIKTQNILLLLEIQYKDLFQHLIGDVILFVLTNPSKIDLIMNITY